VGLHFSTLSDSPFLVPHHLKKEPAMCAALVSVNLPVFLVELLASTVLRTEPMTHLTGVIFVRPTPANIAALARELKSPKFKEYHIFFSNVVVANDLIQTIADADELGVVRQVQEFYADVIPIDRALVSLNSQRLVNTTVGRPAAAILSVFLSLKTRPAQIRFTGSSPATRALAVEVSARLASDDIHDSPLDADSPILIILDRKSDPVTPLLSQWTYQAMVHELLGLNNGRVLLPDVPDGEVTMSGRDDEFFNENKYQNFGALNERNILFLQHSFLFSVFSVISPYPL